METKTFKQRYNCSKENEILRDKSNKPHTGFVY